MGEGTDSNDDSPNRTRQPSINGTSAAAQYTLFSYKQPLIPIHPLILTLSHTTTLSSKHTPPSWKGEANKIARALWLPRTAPPSPSDVDPAGGIRSTHSNRSSQERGLFLFRIVFPREEMLARCQGLRGLIRRSTKVITSVHLATLHCVRNGLSEHAIEARLTSCPY